MNKFLANSVGSLNGLFAGLTILAGGLLSAGLNHGFVGQSDNPGAIGLSFIGGMLGGALVAVFVFGFIALLVQIHHELVAIRAALQPVAPPAQQPSAPRIRQEPRLA
jgi:hypothetical protein